MALDYAKTSKDIVEAVGGVENIASATHCMTRLRLVLKDEGKANDDKVQAIKGVKSVIKQGGQYQVVIGNEVSNLFKEFEKLGNFSEDGGEPAKAEGNVIQRLFGFIAGCMTPLLPAMLGTGMIKVLLTLFTTFGWMESTSTTYILLYSMADCFYYFLPIFLGASIAKKVKGNVYLYMAIGAALCYPDLINLLSNGTELQPLGTFLGMPATSMFGIPVIQATYTSSVLPMLLMAPIMKKVEDFADRVSPNVLKAFLKPMLFCLICFPIVMYVVGPIGNVVGNVLADGFSAMYNTVPWLTVGVLSAAMPFIVMTGMHYALIPLMTNNLALLGYDVVVIVTMMISNTAQGGASLGAAFKSKDTDIKSEGIASGISAIFAGVTEPAMYGINLRFGKPMIGAVIAAGVSGLFAGIVGVRAYTAGGSPSILSLVQLIGGDQGMTGMYLGAVAVAISIIGSFVISYILYKDPESVSAQSAGEVVEEAPVEKKPLVEKIEIAAPVEGKVVDLTEVPDDVFASLALGDGLAIIPSKGEVYAPIDGTVSVAMGHAVGITGENGVEVLVHFGLDTVNMSGAPFDWKVKQGDKVKAGQLLYTADMKAIEEAGYKTHTPVIVTNTNDFVSVVGNAEATDVKVGDRLITVV